MEKIANSYFTKDVTNRDRAIFELGIKLAALFHQFIGTPIRFDPINIKKIEEGIEASISCQPYVKHVSVQIIDRTKEKSTLSEKSHQFDYSEISGTNLMANIELEYKEWKVIGKVEWINELNYPLMYIDKITEI